MKHLIVRIEAALLLASIIISSSACGGGGSTANTAATDAPANSDNTAATTGATTEAEKFSADELDELLARIALYPDPLLAQIIPASTYVDQLKEAHGALSGSTDEARIDGADWDVSVKSVAHYPTLLSMMVENEHWTTSLGQAYVLQPDDVSTSIQRLRVEAMDAGNLVSGPQMRVIETRNIIRLEPAQPKVIYVPQYNPETVYVEQPQQSGVSTETAVAIAAMTFTAGLLIGSWLNNDYDYHGRGIYYHGWTGGGWVGVNRAYVNVNRSVYVNNRYRNLNVNRTIVNRNATAYRRDLTLNAGFRKTRANNARVNNPNRVNNNLPRNAGKNLDRNNLNRNNLDRNRNLAGDRSRNPGGNRTSTPKMNGGNRNRGGSRPSAQPKSVQRGPAPSKQRQRSSPPKRSGGGGRRRG